MVVRYESASAMVPVDLEIDSSTEYESYWGMNAQSADSTLQNCKDWYAN